MLSLLTCKFHINSFKIWATLPRWEMAWKKWKNGYRLDIVCRACFVYSLWNTILEAGVKLIFSWSRFLFVLLPIWIIKNEENCDSIQWCYSNMCRSTTICKAIKILFRRNLLYRCDIYYVYIRIFIFIAKNGIKKIKHMEIKYGSVALFYAVIESILWISLIYLRK